MTWKHTYDTIYTHAQGITNNIYGLGRVFCSFIFVPIHNPSTIFLPVHIRFYPSKWRVCHFLKRFFFANGTFAVFQAFPTRPTRLALRVTSASQTSMGRWFHPPPSSVSYRRVSSTQRQRSASQRWVPFHSTQSAGSSQFMARRMSDIFS